MDNDQSPLIDLLSPSIPSAHSVLAYLRENPGMFGEKQLDGLLEKWTQLPSLHKQQPADTADLVAHLVNAGANPWRVDGLVASWVRHDRLQWVSMAFGLVDANLRPSLIGKEWLHDAVDRLSPMVELLLSFGARQVARSKDGATPLHLATSAAMVSKLCANGADISAINHKGLPPLQTWGEPFAGALGKREIDSLARRTQVLLRSALLAGAPHEAGLAAAPLLLAACGRWQASAMAGAVVSSGMEVVPYPLVPLGLSPIFGWAFSILEEKGDIVSLSGGRALLERGFTDRNGTWDHEWVLAAAALQHLTCARWFKKSTQESVAYEKMHEAIADRLKELEAAPSLDGHWDNRLSAAVEKFKQLRGASGWQGGLYKKAGNALVVALAEGRGAEVAGLNALHLDDVASSMMTYHREETKRLIAACWKNGIPESFWDNQGSIKGKWMEQALQGPLVEYARAQIAQGLGIPPCVKPLSNWPQDVLTAIEAFEISGKTQPATARPSLRRM